MFEANRSLIELAKSKGLMLREPMTLDGHKFALHRIVNGNFTREVVFFSNDINAIAKFLGAEPVEPQFPETIAGRPCGEIELPVGGQCVLGHAEPPQ